MRCITRSLLETGADLCLSPERWLSADTATRLVGGAPLGDVVTLVSQQAIPLEGVRFVLDTGNAREGLLDLPVLGNPTSARTSAKKIAREGDIIFSRLRPYLRQVALLPAGISELLAQDAFYCSTEFFVFRAATGQDIAGLVAWFLSDPIQAMVSEAATGGHHPRINSDLLLSSPVEARYLDPEFSSCLGGVLAEHVAGQRKLNVLLRH